MIDPILQVRLDLFIEAANEIRQISDNARAKRDNLKKCRSTHDYNANFRNWYSLSKSLVDIRASLENANSILLGLADRMVDRNLVEPELQAIQATMCEASNAKDLAAELGNSMEALGCSLDNVTCWSLLSDACSDSTYAIQQYEQCIKNIENIQDDAHAWDEYRRIVTNGAELILRYSDLMATIAIRGSEVEDPTFDIAKKLISMLEIRIGQEHGDFANLDFSFTPIGETIPLRHQFLGRPHWSLWALPLIGKTFGERAVTVISKHEEFGSRLDTDTSGIVQDIFALYLLGPSYLYALVFLLLDPAEISPHDHGRVKTLVSCLPKLDGGRHNMFLQKIADAINCDWDHTLRVNTQNNTSAASLEEAEIHYLFRIIRELYPNAEYHCDEIKTSPLERQLCTDEDPIPGDLLDILNLMWLVRHKNPTSAKKIYQQGQRAIDLSLTFQ